MNLPNDYTRCNGKPDSSACQSCRRREPVSADAIWVSMVEPPIQGEHCPLLIKREEVVA